MEFSVLRLICFGGSVYLWHKRDIHLGADFKK